MTTVVTQEDIAAILALAGGSLDRWAKQCHAASIAIVKSGIFPVARVARGFCKGVGGQHSWVVLSNDCYDRYATIVDPTLWSYDTEVKGIWVGDYGFAAEEAADAEDLDDEEEDDEDLDDEDLDEEDGPADDEDMPAPMTLVLAPGRHTPHDGFGSIFGWGRPAPATGPVVQLTPKKPLSMQARYFLDTLGPLDVQGWAVLAKAPPGGWPAGEILAAMDDTEALTSRVPIDKLGMLTNRNPGGLYLP